MKELYKALIINLAIILGLFFVTGKYNPIEWHWAFKACLVVALLSLVNDLILPEKNEKNNM